MDLMNFSLNSQFLVDRRSRGLYAWNVDEYKHILSIPKRIRLSMRGFNVSNNGTAYCWVADPSYRRCVVCYRTMSISSTPTARHRMKLRLPKKHEVHECVLGCDGVTVFLTISEPPTTGKESGPISIACWNPIMDCFVQGPQICGEDDIWTDDDTTVYASKVDPAMVAVFTLDSNFRHLLRVFCLTDEGFVTVTSLLCTDHKLSWSSIDKDLFAVWDEKRTSIYSLQAGDSVLIRIFSPDQLASKFQFLQNVKNICICECEFSSSQTVTMLVSYIYNTRCSGQCVLLWNFTSNDITASPFASDPFLLPWWSVVSHIPRSSLKQIPCKPWSRSLTELPDEVILMILAHLDVRELASLGLACTKLLRLARDDTLYERMTLDSKVGWGPLMSLLKSSSETWKEFYRKRYIALKEYMCIAEPRDRPRKDDSPPENLVVVHKMSRS